MRKYLLASATVAALALGNAASAFAWSAIAVGPNGWGWASGYGSMESARRQAVRLCRQHGGSCSASTAESDGWYYSGGYCDGIPYTGASPQGWWRSDQIVFMKGAADGNYDCEIVVNK